jgi:elongation factor 1 alpha-like protein
MDGSVHEGLMRPAIDPHDQFELYDFFHDTPWGNVAAHRLCTFSHASTQPRGGLLGGSSKLAALAAARKKKEAEKAAMPATQDDTDRSVGLLDRLGTDNAPLANISNYSKTMMFPSRKKKPTSPERAPSAEVERKTESTPAHVKDLRAGPSIFAQTLLGEESEPQGGVSLQDEDLTPVTSPSILDHEFRLPYMRDPDYIKHHPFIKPSPDDVVLRAQGKDA